MVSVSASDFTAVINDASISVQHAENILDLAIDTLNLYGAAAISNMSGAVGAKTVTLTSKQKGGVFHVARMIYYDFYKGVNHVSVTGITVTAAELLSNPAYVTTIKIVARRLATVKFAVGEDTSGI